MILPSALNDIQIPVARRYRDTYTQFKYSGVDWLPRIPSGWSVKRLRYAVSFPAKSEARGISIDTPVSFVPMEAVGEYGGLNLEQTRPIGEVLDGYTYFAEDDVVVAKITPCFENGKGSLAKRLENGVGFGTTELHVLRAVSELLPQFLFYVTVGEHFRKLGTAEMYGAGGQKRVPERFLKDIRHPIPPLGEQQSIVSFLDRETAKIDELIEKKIRISELLTEKSRATQSLAVTEGTKPVPLQGGAETPWLPICPPHWQILPLRRVLSWIEQGWSPSCDGRVAEPDEWGVLKAGCVNSGELDESENKKLPSDITPDPAIQIRSGDVLMSRACGTASLVGSVAYVKQCHAKLLLCDKVFRLHPNTSRILPQYLAEALKSKSARTQIEQSLSGADGLANNITQATIKRIVIAVPPLSEQKGICDVIEQTRRQVIDLVCSVQTAIGRLRQYRSALIASAVTGQIDVRNFRPEAPCQ